MGCLSVSWLPMQPSVSSNGRNAGKEGRENVLAKGKRNKNINTKIQDCAVGDVWCKVHFCPRKVIPTYKSIGDYATT